MATALLRTESRGAHIRRDYPAPRRHGSGTLTPDDARALAASLQTEQVQIVSP
jgi:succinate dehydrogenase/fumarate reductase flavoprotein subunit